MMVCRASLAAPLAQDADLQDARRRFESHLLRTSQPILERYQFVGRGSARMMRDVHAAYVAELRIIVQLHAWQRGRLVDLSQIGVPAPHGMITNLIERMREARQEYIASELLVPTIGAMFFWWYENCARHAPEHLDTDVIVRGSVTNDVIDELARLAWSLRHLNIESGKE
jgi:hypothetical protein